MHVLFDWWHWSSLMNYLGSWHHLSKAGPGIIIAKAPSVQSNTVNWCNLLSERVALSVLSLFKSVSVNHFLLMTPRFWICQSIWFCAAVKNVLTQPVWDKRRNILCGTQFNCSVDGYKGMLTMTMLKHCLWTYFTILIQCVGMLTFAA